MVAPATRPWFGDPDGSARTVRRVRWRHGAAVLAVAMLALSAVVVPARGQVVAEDPVPEPTPTTVPEPPVTEPPVTEPPVTEPPIAETPTAEPTVPAPTVPEPAVGGQDTTITAVETTDVTTTVEPAVPEPAGGSAARFAPFSAAGALTGFVLTISDGPFAVSQTPLAFGSYAVNSTANEQITLVSSAASDLRLTISGAGGVSITSKGSCGDFLPGGVTLEHDLFMATTCEFQLGIETAVLGQVNGQVIVTDVDSGASTSVAVNAEVVAATATAPANDNWANAQDLSSLAIPAFDGEPGQFPGTQQPRDTVSVNGSTEFATYETNEYFSRPGGSLWYRYTSPPGGFAGRLGYRATPGFFVDVTTENTSATQSQRAQGNTWGPSFIQHVWMEPGHTVWFRVSNEFVDPGRFTLELFQAPDEQDSIVEAHPGGEFALSTNFNLSGNGDTHHLSSDLPHGAPNGWATLRFAVPGFLSVTYRSATAQTVGQFGGSEGSERPLGLRIYRSPQATAVNDPTVLGAAIAVGAGTITDALDCCISGSRWETTATVAVTPGRYYWNYEEDPLGPTFFIFDVRFRAATTVDTEPPTATIITPPDGARYPVGSVPSSVVSTCTDNQGATSSFITVDGDETTSLVTTAGSHTVSLECTDSAGNTTSVTSTYTVFAPTGPCVIVDTQSVDFGDVAVGSTSSTRPVVVRSCSDAPIRLGVSVSNATGGGQTWLATPSTVPSANQFTWSVTPPGAPSPIPVGPLQTAVGPILAPAASRTDDHRIALGPTGPGLGTRFSATFTYTALTP